MSLTPRSVLVSQNMKMPIIGLGTWQSPDKDIERAVISALETGYRHIDTAYVYKNESAIGKTLEKCFSQGKIKREDVFVVTKLPNIGNRAADVERFLKKSLEALKLEYVDLYLIHCPFGLICEKDDNIYPVDENGMVKLDMKTNHIELWKAMEAMVDKGLTKAIGLSNFNIRQIDRILKHCRIPPANLQVEMHIYFQQKELVEFCNKNSITVVAYAPLGSPGLAQFRQNMNIADSGSPILSPINDKVVEGIAKKHGKTPAQVLLRFLMQIGVAVIPKSTNPDRISQNFQVFDFELDENEMTSLKALDRGAGGRMFGLGLFKGAEKHPEYPNPL